MSRKVSGLALAAAFFAVPSVARAAPVAPGIRVDDVAGVAMLLAAALLLVTSIGLERVARGSAIADNMSYVVGACVCLGASALGRWVARLVPAGATVDQIALSSDALTLVAIVLFSVYFLRVRAALRKYLELADADDADLARAEAGQAPSDAGPGPGTGSAEAGDG